MTPGVSRREKSFPRIRASCRLLPWPHRGGIIVDQRAGNRARREVSGAYFTQRGDLGAGAADETCPKQVNSSGMMRRSIPSMPRRLARPVMVRRVIP